MSMAKPTALKIMEGNPGKRALPKNEPKMAVEAPVCPEIVAMDPIALRTWNDYIPILLGMRVLTTADQAILTNLCITHSQLVQALEAVRKTGESGSPFVGRKAKVKVFGAGMMLVARNGCMQINPFFKITQSLMAKEIDFAKELGLTPSARTKVSAAPAQGPKTGWDDLD